MNFKSKYKIGDVGFCILKGVIYEAKVTKVIVEHTEDATNVDYRVESEKHKDVLHVSEEALFEDVPSLFDYLKSNIRD